MAVIFREGTAAATGGASATGRVTIGPGAIAPAVGGASGNLLKNSNPAVSAAPQSQTVLRVSFTEPMPNDAALVLATNYVITEPLAAIPLHISGITPEAVAEPTYVDLAVNEMTDGALYTLVVSNLADIYANAIDGADASATFTGDGTKPSLLSAVATTANRIRLTFDEALKEDSALTSIIGYAITPVTAGASPVYVEDVIVPDIPAVTYVDLVVSEMTNGATYQARVSTTIGPTDAALNHVDGTAYTYNFTGTGSIPIVKQLIAQGANRIDVVFSEDMEDNADIRNTAKYSFDNGLSVLAVLEFTKDTVKLSTTDQTPGTLYTLTIVP